MFFVHIFFVHHAGLVTPLLPGAERTVVEHQGLPAVVPVQTNLQHRQNSHSGDPQTQNIVQLNTLQRMQMLAQQKTQRGVMQTLTLGRAQVPVTGPVTQRLLPQGRIKLTLHTLQATLP